MSLAKELFIYSFSGTGNSRTVARWLSGKAEEKGIPSRIVDIARTDRLHIEPPPPHAWIVFISPIHGFNYPPVMLHYIFRFPKGKNRVLLMNTRAGMLIGKFITPGLTGVAFYLSTLVLKLKGYSIGAMYPVDLPSNWISVHPGLNTRTVNYLLDRNRERVYRFADRVLEGKKDFRALREILQDLLIAPIAILYYLIGRFAFAKTYYASADCDNCQICIKGCPVNAIKQVDNRPFWTFNCESCMKCMSNCPKKAIETAHGSIVILAVIFSSGVLGLLYSYTGQWFSIRDFRLLQIVFESLLFLGLLALWYRILHYAMRMRFIERFIVYTSLTKYTWWGRRYKAPKNR